MRRNLQAEIFQRLYGVECQRQKLAARNLSPKDLRVNSSSKFVLHLRRQSRKKFFRQPRADDSSREKSERQRRRLARRCADESDQRRRSQQNKKSFDEFGRENAAEDFPPD